MTTKKLKRGDVREDGAIYLGLQKQGRSERWYSPQAYHRHSVTAACTAARHRAAKKNVPFDITPDYLLSIFPPNGRCPVLGIKMEWGSKSGLDCSPSLDRIVPHMGYTIGNVEWISNRANMIKSNATTDELCRVAEYMKQKVDCLHHGYH